MERVLYQATTRDAYEHSHLGWSLTYRRHRTVCGQSLKKGTRIMQNIGKRIAKAETAERLYQGNQYIFAFNDRYDIDGKTLKSTPPH